MRAVLQADRKESETEEPERAIEDWLVDLIRQYEHPLVQYLAVVLGERDAALDCVQDTFVRAYEHLAKGREVNSRWLYTVAHNRAMDIFRARRKLDVMPTDMEERAAENMHDEQALLVHRVLERLDACDRDVLYLHICDGFSTEEIAAMLGIRPGALRMRLHRARERFRQQWRALQ